VPFSLIQRLREIPLAFVDVETTGASAHWGHRVIEIGVVRVENGSVVAEYQQLIDPQRRIAAGITALTGIDDAMCAGQPTFTSQLPTLLPILRGAVILGHNIRFDLSFLTAEFRRSGADIALNLNDAPVLDTVRIARRQFGRGGNGLQSLTRRLGIAPDVAHRALADARLFSILMTPTGGWETMLCDAMSAQGGPMRLLPDFPAENPLPWELQESLELGRPVRMEYLDANQRRTERVIQPLSIRRFRGELLLVAHCQLRADRRTFKLDRIIQLHRIDPADATSVPPAGIHITPEMGRNLTTGSAIPN
jgi:DNA polymerase III epsilon subunit family exonuclease